MRHLLAARLLGTFLAFPLVLGIGQESCVSFEQSKGGFPVVSGGRAAPILVSSDDWPGVLRTAADFQADIDRVSGHKPSLTNYTSTSFKPPSTAPIIIGTLGKSSLISQVINSTRLDVSSVEGHWEAFMGAQVDNPLPGVKSAYVIIGADKRGTSYGIYEHSDQFGVSPWYWWADVPVKRRSTVYITANGCSHGSPTVKFRGIFLNDEQPALQNWAQEKFVNKENPASNYTNSPFNHLFYSKLFELLVRMKANYLWPAMWGSAFAIDDPQNQALADMYGVFMGTSHQEPMTRSSPNEWDLFGTGPWNYTTNSENVYEYWVDGTKRAKPYDTVYTLGMRGAGDLPLSEETNIKLLEKVVADQRQILSDVYDGTDITTIPQVWCLYQEVEGYYVDGMRVPDDVTLLWADDLFGNIRRFPLANERQRSGGAGVYYHYDLVGGARSYKWITTTQLSKVYEQMSLAVDRNATRLWVVNVGDLKPYERETEFFINLGWNSSRWSYDNIHAYTTTWAQREFALNADKADKVSEIVANLTRYNARRKPEMINGTTYSLVNYREAETILAEWKTLSDASTKIYNELPSDYKPAYFQLVQHPVTAAATLGQMWIYTGLNNLRSSQARLSVNDLADQVESLFEKDYDIENEYHTMLGGKWNHMMDQTHVQYYYWQQPMANTMPGINRIQGRKQALAGPMRITVEGNPGAWPGDNPNQCAQGYNCPPPTVVLGTYLPFKNRYIDISAGGPNPFTFTAKSNVTWLTLSPSTGSVSKSKPEQRVYVQVNDWSKITGTAYASITFSAQANGQPTSNVNVMVVATHNSVPSDFKGFVEGDGVVSIEAAHLSRKSTVDGITWTELPEYGKTLSAVTPWPRTAHNDGNYTAGAGPSVEYDFYTFNTISGKGSITVTAYVSPSLNGLGADRPISFAIQVDSLPAQVKPFMPLGAPGKQPREWDGLDGFAAMNIVRVDASFPVLPGAHTLKIWMIEPAVVLQKIVINTGGLKPSYLGPPESTRI